MIPQDTASRLLPKVCAGPPRTSCQLHCLPDLSVSHFNAIENHPKIAKKADSSSLWNIWWASGPAQPAVGSTAENKTFLSYAPFQQQWNAALAQMLMKAQSMFLKSKIPDFSESHFPNLSKSLPTFCKVNNYIASQSHLLKLTWSSTFSNVFSSLPANPFISPHITTTNPTNILSIS